MESVKFVDTRTGEIVTQFDIMDIQHMVKLDEYKGKIKPWSELALVHEELFLVLNQLTDKEYAESRLIVTNFQKFVEDWTVEHIKERIKELKQIINNR